MGYNSADFAKQSERDRITQEAFDNPLPGDYWNEMFCPYFVVLKVNADGTFIICEDRETKPGDNWTWDLKKAKQVTKKYFDRVRYDSIDGFVADVFNRCSHMWAVDAWNDLGRPFTAIEPVPEPKPKVNPMFMNIMESAFSKIPVNFTIEDMQVLYECVVMECMDVTRNHTLGKFGIDSDYVGTTQIERVIAEYFDVELPKHE